MLAYVLQFFVWCVLVVLSFVLFQAKQNTHWTIMPSCSVFSPRTPNWGHFMKRKACALYLFVALVLSVFRCELIANIPTSCKTHKHPIQNMHKTYKTVAPKKPELTKNHAGAALRPPKCVCVASVGNTFAFIVYGLCIFLSCIYLHLNSTHG